MKPLTAIFAFALATLALGVAACSTDVASLPDVTKTGQVVVVFAPSQRVQLTPGACEETATDDPQGGVATENPTGRIYYGLEPGPYCLTSGEPIDATNVLVTGRLTLDVVAGAVQYVSVIPAPLSPG